MNIQPLISVIMPFRNSERFFRESIESVLAQRYPLWELFLVDDGSTDGSTGIALKYAERYPERIRYLQHEDHQNRGASASRNLGIQHSRGEYIALLDSDDVWLPYKLYQQVPLLHSKPGVGMLYGNTEYWYSWTGLPEDQQRDFLPHLGVEHNTVITPPHLLTRCLRGQSAVPCTCSVLIRRAVIDAIGGFEESFRCVYTDQAFYAKLFLMTSVFVISDCWDRYRRHPDSCVSVVERAGQLQEARLTFLRWLRQYMTQHAAEDSELWKTLRKELWACQYPRTANISKQLPRLRHDSVEQLKTAARQILPEAAWRWIRRQWRAHQ